MCYFSVDINENEIVDLCPGLISILLKDKASDKNIIWATDNYASLGHGYQFKDHISIDHITGSNSGVIKPRTKKTVQAQSSRSREKAEVFTPAWICNAQNNLIDNDWFGRECVFNKELYKSWRTIEDRILFPKEPSKGWKDYVLENRLEITCGEAPYLVSRYEATTGDPIEIPQRIGILDRKLRIVSENTTNESEWYEWAVKAYQSTYGFDYQGDNILLARENLFASYIDYYLDKFNAYPSREQLITITDIISWNIWQMDAIKFVIPESCVEKPRGQISLFDDELNLEKCYGCTHNIPTLHTGIYCLVKDWKLNKITRYIDLIV